MTEKRRATTFRTSRGAIVNVAYPDIYIAPSIAPVDVTSPAEMREALREELERPEVAFTRTITDLVLDILEVTNLHIYNHGARAKQKMEAVKLYAAIGAAGEYWSFDGETWTKEYTLPQTWMPYGAGNPIRWRGTTWRSTEFLDNLVYAGEVGVAGYNNAQPALVIFDPAVPSWSIRVIEYGATEREAFGFGIIGNRLFICVYNNGRVYSTTDLVNFTLEGTLPGGRTPHKIATLGGSIYLFSTNSNIVDTYNGALWGTVAGSATETGYQDVAEFDGAIYISGRGTGNIYKFDGTTFTLLFSDPSFLQAYLTPWGTLLFIGGWDDQRYPGSGGVWCYNSLTKRLACILSTPAAYCSICPFKGYLYIGVMYNEVNSVQILRIRLSDVLKSRRLEPKTDYFKIGGVDQNAVAYALGTNSDPLYTLGYDKTTLHFVANANGTLTIETREPDLGWQTYQTETIASGTPLNKTLFGVNLAIRLRFSANATITTWWCQE